MNRQLMALAVFILFFGLINGVHAGAKIYGKINLSFESLDDGTNSGMYLSSNSSRFGLKGSESLDGSLKLVWQIESGISTGGDFGGATLASRNTYIGVAGEFGTILAGKHDTPLKILGRKVDLFGDQIGDSRNLTRLSNGGSTGFDERRDNIVIWKSKDLSGLNIMAALVADDGVDNSGGMSAHGIYNKGPLMVGAGFENHGKGTVGGGGKSSSAFRAVVSYNLQANNVKINGLLQQVSDAGGVSGADFQTIGVGASFKEGTNLFKAQLYMANGDLSDTSATMLAFGVDHKLTNKTKVYGAYAMTSNDDNIGFSAFGGGHGENPDPADGENPTGFSVGIVHSF